MDFFSIALAAGIGLLLGWLMVRSKNTDYTRVKVISRKDFVENMRKGQLIDIRKQEEFVEDKIKGARNFNPRALTSKGSKIRKDQSVFLYCSNGRKSKRVGRKLARNDVGTIYILDGGFETYCNPKN